MTTNSVIRDTDFYSALSKEEVVTTISNHLGPDNFKLINYELRAAGDNMLGFLGIHFKIYAQVETNGELKQLQYFAKKMPMEISAHNYYARQTRAFFKEIYFYERLIRDVKNNMKPGKKQIKWCPEFYFARGEEIFVVEDLSLQGYSMYPERQELDIEHIFATMKAFAAMHAGVMMLEEKLRAGTVQKPPIGWSPGKPADLAQVYSDILFETEASGEPGHPGNIFYEAGIKSQLAIVDLLPNYTDEQREKIKKQLPDLLRKMFELVKPSTRYRNTWTHGDMWSNNVMFRKKADGTIENAVLIDFQLARYAPPAHDLILFMHMVQRRAFREKHLQEALDYYYAAFTEEVAAEGFDVQTILPREEFQESCDYYYECSLLSQVLYYQLILSPPRITEKYLTTAESFNHNMLEDRTVMITDTFNSVEECRSRVIEVMNELIEFYHLVD